MRKLWIDCWYNWHKKRFQTQVKSLLCNTVDRRNLGLLMGDCIIEALRRRCIKFESGIIQKFMYLNMQQFDWQLIYTTSPIFFISPSLPPPTPSFSLSCGFAHLLACSTSLHFPSSRRRRPTLSPHLASPMCPSKPHPIAVHRAPTSVARGAPLPPSMSPLPRASSPPSLRLPIASAATCSSPDASCVARGCALPESYAQLHRLASCRPAAMPPESSRALPSGGLG